MSNPIAAGLRTVRYENIFVVIVVFIILTIFIPLSWLFYKITGR